MALHGGDDYELLFTVPRNQAKHLRAAPGFRALRAIGEITAGREVILTAPEDHPQRLESLGWDMFRRK
jgi:thiamine monophosphate kinase